MTEYSNWELFERFVAPGVGSAEIAAMDFDTLVQQIHEMRVSEPDDIPMTDRDIARGVLEHARENTAA